ncbi:RHS repeat-associated core domain-containing protein [Luteibacter sp. E-22]|uniref:RHS repeat-associated core domain-containing protein n=1 Tax=Luteibacter sp. E-22 TaxID=3404050 RepID=UPI003CEAFBDC
MDLAVVGSANSFSGEWTSTQSGCPGGQIYTVRYGSEVGKKLGSGATCEGGEGSSAPNLTTGCGGGPQGNADGSSCAEQGGVHLAGDPIDTSTGNFYLEETDYDGGEWLSFRRFYNSTDGVAPAQTGFNWRHSFNRSLQMIGSPVSSIVALRPDGSQEEFKKIGGVWSSNAPVNTLSEILDSSGAVSGYRIFIGPLRHTEKYDLSGTLTSVTGQDGYGITLDYDRSGATPLVEDVTDTQGRQLKFYYDSYTDRLSSVSFPDGGYVRFSYASSTANLQSAIHSDSSFHNYLYNEDGMVGAVSLPHAITGITDSFGKRYETITYDDQGRATSSGFVGEIGTTRITYQGDGSASVTYPLGNTVHVDFDRSGGRAHVASLDKSCVPDCGRAWKTRTYDALGFPASFTDFNGVTTRVGYNDFYLLESQIDAEGTQEQRTTATTWNIDLRLPSVSRILDRQGNLIARTEWKYNALGKVVARCDTDPSTPSSADYECSVGGTPPAGVRRWTYTYCEAVDTTQCPIVGLLLTATGPRADVMQVTTYSYYLSDGAYWKRGDIQSIKNALGQMVTIPRYDGAGRPQRTVDANGVITEFYYTGRGLLSQRIVHANADGSNSSLDAWTTVSYDRNQKVVQTQDPDKITLTYGYDAALRLTKVSDRLGNYISYTYNQAGGLTGTSVYDTNNVLRYRDSATYDAIGRLVSRVDGLGRETFSAKAADAYDGNGNLLSSLDGSSVETRRSYDHRSRLVDLILDAATPGGEAIGATTTLQYDALDNVIGVGDPSGLPTVYIRNAFGELNSSLSPDSGSISASRDEAGNILEATDARGIHVSYTYDALNRRTSSLYPSTEDNVAWYYDEPSEVTGCASSYPVGRLTRVVEALVTTTYCYDHRGNIVKKIQAQGSHVDSVTYSYSLGDRLLTETLADGTQVNSSRADSLGRVTSVTTTRNGSTKDVATSIQYLPFGPILSYTLGSSSGAQNLMRTYDLNYAVTSVVSPQLVFHGTRDVRGNFSSIQAAVDSDRPLESYNYDALGRLTTVSNGSGNPIEVFTYDAAGDRQRKEASGAGGGDYVYKTNTHWLTSVGAASRTYDSAGNTSVIAAAGTVFGFGYNGRGQLTVVQQDGGDLARYTFNASGDRISKSISSPQGREVRFIYDEEGKLLAEYGASSRTYIWVSGLPIGVLDVDGSSSTLSLVHADSLGTPRAVTASDGSLVWSWAVTANPFGEAAPVSSTGFSLNLRFPGQYFDGESGLAYNIHRFFDPTVGRYLQSDPLGLAAGSNTYLYASANPLRFIDPLGLTDLNLFVPGSAEYRAAKNFTSPPGTYVVGAHGNPLNVVDQNGSALRPEQLATMIQNDPTYQQGETVLLLSCNTGVTPEAKWNRSGSFAQRLASSLKANAQAPDHFGWLFPSGSFESRGGVVNGKPVQWDNIPIIPSSMTPDPADPGTLLEFKP